METQELPINNENQSRTEKATNKNVGRFTKLQSFLILFVTLIACLVGGYFISDKYLWPNADEQRLLDQINHYKDLVDSKPNNAENRVNLGYSYYLNGTNDDAIKQLKMAIELDKNNSGAYFNLGLVYLDEKQYNDALIQAQKTVDLAPKDYRSNLLVGMAYRHLKMYDQALESLQQALQQNSTNTDTINEIAKVFEDQKKYDDAEKLYKQALSFDPLDKKASEGLKRIVAINKNKDNK
jgi:tetratricopeptide (TPR) repeat protein